MSYQNWLSSVFLVVVVLATGAAGFNYFTDPWALNLRWVVDGVNRYKAETIGVGRLTKAYAVVRERPVAAVFGTSTAEQGISPDHNVWNDVRPAINLAFPGASISEISAFLQYAHAVVGLKRVVIGLDFFSFNTHLAPNPQFREALAAMTNPLARMRPYISSEMLFDGLRQTWSQGDLGPYHLRSGQTDPQSFHRWKLRIQGHRHLFLFSERGLTRGLLPAPVRRYEFQAGDAPSTIEQLSGLVNFLRRERIETKLFISPSHARQTEVIGELGLWPQFERWKRQIASVVYDGNASVSSIVLWDFADYSSPLQEEVPQSPDGDMHWFWDSQHYKQELGDVVLAKLFGQPTSSAFDDFGRQLTGSNVEAVLAEIRQRRVAYVTTHIKDVLEIKGIVEQQRN